MVGLSKREMEVLSLVGQGMRGKKIALALGISEFTVRKHRASIMRKLGLHGAAQLIAHAVKMKQGQGPPPRATFPACDQSAAAA
jgi:DNA-binding CsgD family transcriptional regulator